MLTATYSRINGLIPSLFIPINPHPHPIKVCALILHLLIKYPAYI